MNKLAAGIHLEKKELVDTALGHRHQLSDEGRFIVAQWLEQYSSKQIAKAYAKAFEVPTTQAQSMVLDLLIDLSRHYILDVGRLPRRFVMSKLWHLVWAGGLILVSQLPVLFMVGFTFALIGLGLGYPVLITLFWTMVGLWLMLLVHEFGHAIPLMVRGHSVVLIREKVRVRLLYSSSAHAGLVVVASSLGPFVAAAAGVGCAVAAGRQTNPTTVWVLLITALLGVWQLVSLLPVFEDGKTLRYARSRV